MGQRRTPLADALRRNRDAGFIPFDVPGHKGGLSFLADYYGRESLSLDMNSREQLDYLLQPAGCIREAQELAAEAFGAANAWFMVNGTTSAVQAMIMSVCPPDSKILLPRNVHSSVINAVILSGAVPVYMHPSVHDDLGISLGIRTEDIIRYIENNTDASAIVINNPTYYGICSSLREIVQIAHAHGILVLADEAHGTHFYFGDNLPEAAMRCGADMSAVSMHKTGGSLTQSSLLLAADSVDPAHVLEIINLSCTTSASYLLLSSLDLARSFLATEGRETIARILSMTENARGAINSIDGLYAFADEISSSDDVFDFDRTKLSVCTSGIGLAGIEVYRLLRDRYGIQIEFGDMNNILAVGSIGDRPESYEKLVAALADIAVRYRKPTSDVFDFEYIKPIIRMSPRKAFFGIKQPVPIWDAAGRICCGSVMCYPPGIPILAPGELVTREIVDHILHAQQKGCTISGLIGGDRVPVLV